MIKKTVKTCIECGLKIEVYEEYERVENGWIHSYCKEQKETLTTK